VLHSWNQRLQFHPHVHCVLAAGGLAPDHSRWNFARRSFFLPIGVLNRATLLPLCLQLLGAAEQSTLSAAQPPTEETHSIWNCPVCGGTMRVVERLSAAQLLLRSPPQPDRCAA
jgi:hypothetical protein